MASTDSINNFFGSLFQLKMTDDVTNLLSTPVASQQKLLQTAVRQQHLNNHIINNTNNISNQSTSRLSTNSTLSATSNDTVTESFSASIDLRNMASKKFEEQIKYLDKQAKDLQTQMQNNSSRVNEFSSASSTPQIMPMLPKNPPPALPLSIANQINIIDTLPLISSTSSSSMRNTSDLKDDETFYEKIK